MKVSLRVLLSLALILLTALPVTLLGVWVQQTTMEQEYSRVHDKHLLLAKSITLALDRYAVDIKSVFRLMISRGNRQGIDIGISKLARNLHFASFRVENASGEIIESQSYQPGQIVDIPQKIVENAWSADIGNEITVHPVSPDTSGEPKIYLSRNFSNKRLAIAAVCLDYIQELQGTIRFGQSGHSAIVDNAGNLMAHPNKEWVVENRNISKLAPVKAMIAGQSGVIEFFSPATNKDMITGYSVVPHVGWGVMIPQALDELKDSAKGIRYQLWSVLIVGILLTAIFAWWLAEWIISPLKRITRTANHMNSGDLKARVLPFVRVPAYEFKELGVAFDQMAQSLQNNNAQLEIKLAKQRLESSDQHSSVGTEGNILVVDDSPVKVLELTGWLSKAGYSTFSALSNEESLKIASVIQPDLAIIGVLSVTGGGFQNRLKLISLLKGVNIPVVAIFPENISDEEINEIGIHAITSIRQPVDEKLLLEAVSDLRQVVNWKNLDVKFI